MDGVGKVPAILARGLVDYAQTDESGEYGKQFDVFLIGFLGNNPGYYDVKPAMNVNLLDRCMMMLFFIGISCSLKCLQRLYQFRIGKCIWGVSGIKRNQILDKEVSWAKDPMLFWGRGFICY